MKPKAIQLKVSTTGLDKVEKLIEKAEYHLQEFKNALKDIENSKIDINLENVRENNNKEER
ncbi:MAG: hypothetical protein ACFFDF_03735 [Candidatus Odinarchaeota archaeon]